MRLHTKLIVTALAATALFASLAASASARNISITNRNIRVQFEPLVFVNSTANVSCRVTLEGSFHCATISKVNRALVGFISRATSDLPTCRSSSFTLAGSVRQETLPWHLTYLGFIGRLPNAIVILLLENAGFDILRVPLLGTCSYTARAEGFVSGPGGRGGTGISEGNANITPDESRRIRSSTGGCPEGSFSSRVTPVTLLGNTTAIRARLT
jgi:hypothetical protein